MAKKNTNLVFLSVGLTVGLLALVFAVFMFYFLPNAKKQIRPLVLTELEQTPQERAQQTMQNQPQQTPKQGEIGIKFQENFEVYYMGVFGPKPEKFSKAEKTDDGYVFFAKRELMERVVIRFSDDNDDCWYRPKPGILENTAGIIELYKDERSLESMCEEWKYAPNIVVHGVVFPSELSDTTEVSVEGEAPLYLTFKITLRDLKQHKGEENFWIERGWEAGFSAETKFVAPVATILSMLPKTPEHMQSKLPYLFDDVERRVSMATKFIGPVANTNDASRKLTSVTNSLHPIAEWFEKLSEPEQMDLVSQYAPIAAKIAVKLLNKEMLERFLLNLDWEKDVVTADPRWYNGWYEIQPDREKRVAHFMNLSFRDLEFRLFWARRGETFFRIVKRAVSDEVVAMTNAR